MKTTPAHPDCLYGVVPYNDRVERIFMNTFSYSAPEAKKVKDGHIVRHVFVRIALPSSL